MDKYGEKNLKKLIKESKNFSDVSRKLNGNNYYGNRQTIIRYVKKYDIDYSHFIGSKGNRGGYGRYKKKLLSDVLVENSTYVSTHNLKLRLYNEGLKKRKCELCGQGEMWNDMKISLILDHKNGVNDDNRIENLRIVCPNCNAGLSTHGGKNIKVDYIYHNPNEPKKKYYTKKTDNEKKEKIKEVSLIQRKVERPSYNQLMMDIKIFGYKGTGERYGVSDNAIRKWKKFYEKHENTIL